VGTLLGGNLTSEGNVTNDPESLRAIDLQSERFPRVGPAVGAHTGPLSFGAFWWPSS
jgi:hypothetical protein